MIPIRPKSTSRARAGFTLVELAVVIVVIGVLAAFGVPRFVRSVEQSRAVEAFDYLATVRAAQEHHQARHGTYAENLRDLGIRAAPSRYFHVPATFSPSAGGATLRDSWSLTLTRAGSPSGHGAYTVTFTEAGFDAASSTIAEEPNNSEIGPVLR